MNQAVLLVPVWLMLLATSTALTNVDAVAQEVVLRGASDVAVDRRLEQLLETGPLLVTSDTAIARGDTVVGSVLVLDASLVHEGVITGDLVLVDAGAFVRPGAVVGGDLVNIAGGLYRSEIARVHGLILDLPTASYRVVREPERLVIEATRVESPLMLDGLWGLHPPTYDRVNGVTLVWGAAYRLPFLGRVQPVAHAQAGWQTQRGDPTYGADLSLRRGATVLTLGHVRGWDTNERWIRGDLTNSLVYLWDGGDLRDYHEVETTRVELGRDFADRTRRFAGSVTVRGQLERAASLEAGQPWFIWGSETRRNPGIQDGRTASLVGAAGLAWDGSRTRFVGELEYELARPWLDGEFEFDLLRSHGSWAMLAFANHTLAIDFYVQHPLGDRPLPGQRWSFVGGTNTLHTLPTASHRGDRVVFVESRYVIPAPDRFALRVLGVPRLHLLHAAGMAWTEGGDGSLHQELAIQLDLAFFYVRYAVVPDDPSITDLSIRLSWPFGRRYPWES